MKSVSNSRSPGSTAILGLLIAAALQCFSLLVPEGGKAAPQGPWVLPGSNLAAAGEQSVQPQIAFGDDGTAVAVWNRTVSGDATIQAASRSPGGAFGTPVDLSAPDEDALEPQAAIAPDGTVIVVWYRFDGAFYRIQASTRPPGGAFSAPENLSAAGRSAFDPGVAFGPDSSATVVWRRNDNSDFIVQISDRPAGGSFGTPQNLSDTGASAVIPRIATGEGGTTAIVWRRVVGGVDAVQIVVREQGGIFPGPTTISDTSNDADSPEVAVAPDGALTAVWHWFNGANSIVQSKTRLANYNVQPLQDMSSPGVNAFYPEIAIGPDGVTTATWERSGMSSQEVRVATKPAGGTFATPVTISGTGKNSFLPQLAIAPDRTTSVVWRDESGPDFLIQASTRPPDGTFGTPVPISAAGESASEPQIAIGPDGTATAVWRRFDGTHPIVQSASTAIPTFTLSVTRDGSGSGTVTSIPAGIDCGADCSEDYTNYSQVTLTATPDTGSGFSGWSGACLGAVGTTCDLKMTEARSATASFAADPDPPPPSKVCPPKKLKPKKLFRNKRKGIAKLKVVAGGKGKVILKRSKKVKKSVRKVGKKGKTKLKIKPKRKFARKLRKRGKVKFRVKLVYRPGKGCPGKKKTRKVKLIRR